MNAGINFVINAELRGAQATKRGLDEIAAAAEAAERAVRPDPHGYFGKGVVYDAPTGRKETFRPYIPGGMRDMDMNAYYSTLRQLTMSDEEWARHAEKERTARDERVRGEEEAARRIKEALEEEAKAARDAARDNWELNGSTPEWAKNWKSAAKATDKMRVSLTGVTRAAMGARSAQSAYRAFLRGDYISATAMAARATRSFYGGLTNSMVGSAVKISAVTAAFYGLAKAIEYLVSRPGKRFEEQNSKLIEAAKAINQLEANLQKERNPLDKRLAGMYNSDFEKAYERAEAVYKNKQYWLERDKGRYRRGDITKEAWEKTVKEEKEAHEEMLIYNAEKERRDEEKRKSRLSTWRWEPGSAPEAAEVKRERILEKQRRELAAAIHEQRLVQAPTEAAKLAEKLTYALTEQARINKDITSTRAERKRAATEVLRIEQEITAEKARQSEKAKTLRESEEREAKDKEERLKREADSRAALRRQIEDYQAGKEGVDAQKALAQRRLDEAMGAPDAGTTEGMARIFAAIQGVESLQSEGGKSFKGRARHYIQGRRVKFNHPGGGFGTLSLTSGHVDTLMNTSLGLDARADSIPKKQDKTNELLAKIAEALA